MGISEVQIGVPAPITPPIDKNLRISKQLDEFGYDSMWYPDHLMGWIPDSIWTPDLIPLSSIQKTPHTYLETFSLIAAHSVLTNNIKMGTGVSETLRRHPAQIAQIMLTLDQLSKGRVIFGFGAGEAENTIPYGIDYSKPVSKFEENLRIIRLFLNNPYKKINYKGNFWTLNDAIIGIEPYNKNQPPPIWIGAHGPRMLKITAELADGWIPIGMPIDDYKEKLKIIQNYAKKFDRSIDEITPAIYFYTVLANEHEDCHKMMISTHARAWVLTAFDSLFRSEGLKHPLNKILNKENVNPLTDYIPIKLERNETLQALINIPFNVIDKFYLHGTYEDVIKIIEKYAKIGCKHFILWNFTGIFNLRKYNESNQILLNILKYIKNR